MTPPQNNSEDNGPEHQSENVVWLMDTISNTASSYDCTEVVVKAADGAAFIVDKQQTRLVFYNMALDLPTSNDEKNGHERPRKCFIELRLDTVTLLDMITTIGDEIVRQYDKDLKLSIKTKQKKGDIEPPMYH